MSMEIETPLNSKGHELRLTDAQLAADLDAFIATVRPAPKYGGLKYTAAWWAHYNASRGR